MRDGYFNLEINHGPGVPRESIILNADLSCPREQKVTTLNGDYEIRPSGGNQNGLRYSIYRRTQTSLPEKSNLAKNLSPNSSIARVILNNKCSLHLLDSPQNIRLKEISIRELLLHRISNQFLESRKNLPSSPRYGPLPKRK